VFFYFLFGMVFDIFNSQPFLLVDLSHYLQRKWGTIIYQITIYIISARTSAVICWKYTDNKLAFRLIKCAEWLCKLNLIAPHLLRLMVNGYSKRLDQIKNKKTPCILWKSTIWYVPRHCIRKGILYTFILSSIAR